VARRVQDALDRRLVDVWLVGPAALQDYDPRCSDVDVQAVATERLSLSERRGLATRLEHGVLATPARGLEFVLYAQDDLAAAGGPRYQLNLNTGARMDHHLTYDADDDPRFSFTIDVSIARQGCTGTRRSSGGGLPGTPTGAAGHGGARGSRLLRRGPGAEDQTLLSACHARAWAVDGVWRSKGDSARWAMRRLPDPHLIERALRRQDGQPVDPPAREDVDRTLASAQAALAAVGHR
jgi:hypothetical protein